MNPEPYLYKDTLIWTMTTNGYKYMTLNLIKTIEAAKCPWKLLVVAGDYESHAFFRKEGISVILYTKAQKTQETTISRWGSPQFQRYNFIKLDIAHTFSQNPKIKRCVYMDGDITLFNDFLPDLTMRLDTQQPPQSLGTLHLRRVKRSVPEKPTQARSLQSAHRLVLLLMLPTNTPQVRLAQVNGSCHPKMN